MYIKFYGDADSQLVSLLQFKTSQSRKGTETYHTFKKKNLLMVIVAWYSQRKIENK